MSRNRNPRTQLRWIPKVPSPISNLPNDLYFEIYKYLSREDEPYVRRINKRFSRLPFDVCCQLPSTSEIAR